MQNTCNLETKKTTFFAKYYKNKSRMGVWRVEFIDANGKQERKLVINKSSV